MHRLGSGDRVADIAAARAEWQAANRTVSTYCTKREWEAWQDDLGTLVFTSPSGDEYRSNATIKTRTHGGSYRIVHNCCIIGNPQQYAAWAGDPNRQGWMGEWTFYPNRDLQGLIEHHEEAPV